jgi:hypothetical protein
VTYLERNVLSTPWANMMALLAAIMIARRFETSSVLCKIVILHSRFSSLFECLGLARMEDWDPAVHIPMYLGAEILPDDPQSVRQRFWVTYSSASKTMAQWLSAFREQERPAYQQFILPALSRLFVEGLIRRKEITQQQQRARKAETDAVVPRFAAIQAEAHFRQNRVARLRRAYMDALRGLQPRTRFPVTFSYEEGGDKERGIPAQERLRFRIWDRRSFVLAHADMYSYSVVTAARRGVGTFADDVNHLFLEFVRAERLFGEAPAAGFWFEEIFKLGVTGLNGSEGQTSLVGLLGIRRYAILRRSGRATHMACEGWKVHGICTASNHRGAPACRGDLCGRDDRLAGDRSVHHPGARINEVMQIRLTDDCIVRLKMPPPPEAKDQSPRVRYVLRLIPKGEKANVPQDYFIGEETKRLFVRTAQMLGEHYRLEPGQALPSVRFAAGNGRAERFGQAPYLFQYAYQYLSANTITSCMRFLLHGMVFKTREGTLVVLKSHLLRHAFATHAVQVEKIPIDIVGAWLHQKNLAITDYYSRPTESMVAEASDLYLSRIAAQINVNQAVLRSPEELQRIYESARGKAGTLADVIGGQCVSHGYCAAKFACVGCAGKVPDPAKRRQVERHKEWALLQVDYASKEGLHPEAERMRQLIRDCDNELAEMDMIDAYRRDECLEVRIQIEPAT